MKRKSPLSIDRIQFFTYGCDQVDELSFIDQFPYDTRHDFLVDRSFSGIAIKVEISNTRCEKGARRNVSFFLVDFTERCEIARQQVKVSLAKDGFKDYYIYFSAEPTGIVSGHTYKLVVCDETSSETLTESIIHLFDSSAMGEPTEWYKVCDGGIRPTWKSSIFKSLNTVDVHEYMVQFNVAPNMGRKLPNVMPELEIRLYYPIEGYVKAFFKEPFCFNMEAYDDNRWTVECPFETLEDINGVFYAELLCMEYPIAGFVFDTMSSHDVSGSWYGHGIEPMDEYSLEHAMKLIDEYIPYRNESEPTIETNFFDELLDRFITSLRDNPGDEEETETNEEADTR